MIMIMNEIMICFRPSVFLKVIFNILLNANSSSASYLLLLSSFLDPRLTLIPIQASADGVIESHISTLHDFCLISNYRHSLVRYAVPCACSAQRPATGSEKQFYFSGG